MWRILNKLFGWDYVAWKLDYSAGISRLCKDGLGQPYYQRDRYIGHITTPDQVIWLTCHPSKYLGGKND